MKLRKYLFDPVILTVIIIIIIIISLVITQNKKTSVETINDSKDSQQLADFEVEEVVRNLNKVLLLPQNEKPFVAKIVNVDVLKSNQPFYLDAKNGDYVIGYSSISRAIIFDAENGKIINIAAVTQNTETADNSLISTTTIKQDAKK